MNVTMTATLGLRHEALEIAYTIDNREDHDIGVFNWIAWTRPDGTQTFLRRTAFIELVEDILLVRKMALPVPHGLHLAAYVPANASRIAARSVFVERIALDLPVVVMQPFRAALIAGRSIGLGVSASDAGAYPTSTAAVRIHADSFEALSRVLRADVVRSVDVEPEPELQPNVLGTR